MWIKFRKNSRTSLRFCINHRNEFSIKGSKLDISNEVNSTFQSKFDVSGNGLVVQRVQFDNPGSEFDNLGSRFTCIKSSSASKKISCGGSEYFRWSEFNVSVEVNLRFQEVDLLFIEISLIIQGSDIKNQGSRSISIKSEFSIKM